MNKPKEPARQVIPIASQSASGQMVSLYAPQEKIYPRTVSGVFSHWRWAMVWLTQLVFYGLPWLEWGQRQAVLFDLGARRFYVFGLVLYPQDFIYLTGLLVISALALFLFTAVAGRLWCGFACPQTVYTEMFLWIERKVEGDRSARMRRDAQAWSAEKLLRKSGKHVSWLLLSWWTGMTFVGYFTPITALSAAFLQLDLSAWELFWMVFYALATYGNAGFLREEVCKHMCPYARFQSAMFDKDTLVVTYDTARGEPRGARSRQANPKTLDLGACVDCTLCVQVCPTGIDIRKGLQYECIGCGACADVCDPVMDKMGYARGLIRFSTENAMDQGWGAAQIWRRVMRPRVLVYTGVLMAIVVAMGFSLALRTPFRVDVVRDRSVMARVVAGGNIENLYRLQVMNATERPQQYQIAATGLPGLRLGSESLVSVASTASSWVTVRLVAPFDTAEPGSYPIRFEIQSLGADALVSEKSSFVVPR